MLWETLAGAWGLVWAGGWLIVTLVLLCWIQHKYPGEQSERKCCNFHTTGGPTKWSCGGDDWAESDYEAWEMYGAENSNGRGI